MLLLPASVSEIKTKEKTQEKHEDRLNVWEGLVFCCSSKQGIYNWCITVIVFFVYAGSYQVASKLKWRSANFLQYNLAYKTEQ